METHFEITHSEKVQWKGKPRRKHGHVERIIIDNLVIMIICQIYGSQVVMKEKSWHPRRLQ